MSKNWKIEGNYFESCTCDVVCPCIFLKEKSMVIKGVGEVKVHALEGADGKHVTVDNPPLAVAPGHAIAVHETDVMKYDHEEKHSHTGTVSLASAFTYQPD